MMYRDDMMQWYVMSTMHKEMKDLLPFVAPQHVVQVFIVNLYEGAIDRETQDLQII